MGSKYYIVGRVKVRCCAGCAMGHEDKIREVRSTEDLFPAVTTRCEQCNMPIRLSNQIDPLADM